MGVEWDFMEVEWEFHRISWASVEFNRISWDLNEKMMEVKGVQMGFDSVFHEGLIGFDSQQWFYGIPIHLPEVKHGRLENQRE